VTSHAAKHRASFPGTPTLFVGGVLHQGGSDTEALLEALAR
jgi:hypothetical protein